MNAPRLGVKQILFPGGQITGINTDLDKFWEYGYVVLHRHPTADLMQSFAARAAGVKQDAVSLFNKQIAYLDNKSTDFTENMIELFAKDFQTLKNTGVQAQNLMSLYELMLHPLLKKLIAYLGVREPIVNTKPVLFFHSPHLAQEEIYHLVPGHQDYSSMQSSLNSIVAWTPLAPISMDMGPLMVVPKSHLKGLVATNELTQGFGLVDGYTDDDFFSVGPLVPGDIVLFSSLLVHRSGKNKTDNIRWTANFRYADAADNYWIEKDYYSSYTYHPNASPALLPTEQDMSDLLKGKIKK